MNPLDALLAYIATEWKSSPFISHLTVLAISAITLFHPGFKPSQTQQNIIIIAVVGAVTLSSVVYNALSHKTRQTLVNAVKEVVKSMPPPNVWATPPTTTATMNIPLPSPTPPSPSTPNAPRPIA